MPPRTHHPLGAGRSDPRRTAWTPGARRCSQKALKILSQAALLERAASIGIGPTSCRGMQAWRCCQLYGQRHDRFIANPDAAQQMQRRVRRPKARKPCWGCGLASRICSTRATVVKHISSIELHTAFECLADAVAVDPQVSSDIIRAMEDRLGDAVTDPDVACAFAALGSGRGERSQMVFGFLAASLNNANELHSRHGAIVALSLTNMPQAAALLGQIYQVTDTSLRASLVRMGDVGLPALVARTRAGVDEALDDIDQIATPAAALCLAALMESTTGLTQGRTAWRLGALIGQPGVEAAIAQRTIAAPKNEQFAWVWQPFGDPRSAVGSTVSRLCELIPQSDPSTAGTNVPLDPRIAVPVAVESLGGRALLIDTDDVKAQIRRLLDTVQMDASQSTSSPTAGLGDVHVRLNDLPGMIKWFAEEKTVSPRAHCRRRYCGTWMPESD
jgi:hypothetical protein